MLYTPELLISKTREKIGESAVFPPHTEALYALICEYLNRDAAFERRVLKTQKKDIPFSLKKGLCLISPPGTGKTFIFEDLFDASRRLYRCTTAYDLQSLYTENGPAAHFDWEEAFKIRDSFGQRIPLDSRTVSVYIDDIGRESKSVKHYGNELNFMDIFIERRVRLFKKFGTRTHASSNLTIPQLKEYYSQRTYSRFFKLFNFVVIQSETDFRI